MRTKGVIAAGLGQVLLLALWAMRQGLLLSASLFGLSLLPIGFSFHLGWLRGVAVAWWVLFLILVWQHGGSSRIGDAVGALGRLAFLQGGNGLEVALALLVGSLAYLTLTALTHLLAALAATPGASISSRR